PSRRTTRRARSRPARPCRKPSLTATAVYKCAVNARRTQAAGLPILLTFDGAFGGSHCLIFAGSGGFKTTGSVISTGLTWAGPIVCFDPSTEIVPLVRGHRGDG